MNARRRRKVYDIVKKERRKTVIIYRYVYGINEQKLILLHTL